MRKGFISTVTVYSLCVSFLLLMNGFPQRMAEAKETGFPIGEMVSRGEVKIEVKEGVWKSVEPSLFPLFKNSKVRTEKGTALITLAKMGQIEMDQNTQLSLDQSDRWTLSQGRIDFRIPTNGGIDFKVKDLSVTSSRSLHVSTGQARVAPEQPEIVGSIWVHSNGSVTVRSLQGSLSVMNQDRVVIAGVSSKESVTVPSMTVKGAPRVMVAQAGEVAAGGSEAAPAEFLGLGTWAWVGIGAGAAVIGGVAIGAGGGGGGGGHAVPVCP